CGIGAENRPAILQGSFDFLRPGLQPSYYQSVAKRVAPWKRGTLEARLRGKRGPGGRVPIQAVRAAGLPVGWPRRGHLPDPALSPHPQPRTDRCHPSGHAWIPCPPAPFLLHSFHREDRPPAQNNRDRPELALEPAPNSAVRYELMRSSR